MKRTYLELVRKYFPGAKAVTLRTPFDLTQRSIRLPRLNADSFHDTDSPNGWAGDIAWNR